MAQNLVVVESPAKAKTIEKYLGKDYKVLASVGHVRDLPESALGIAVENGFALDYVVNDDKKKVIHDIAAAAKKADAVYLATDYDREGEAIAWHVAEACAIPVDKRRRVTFTEITRRAVTEAIEHPRDIDDHLVDAQQARRAIDRLVGYPVSQLLWKKIRYGLSAGRVQSPALRLIVEREREIRAFVSVEYWSLAALLETDSKESFRATLVQIGDRKIPTKIDPDSSENLDRILTGEEAEALRETLRDASFRVEDVRTREQRRVPPPPFITSSFQMEASRKLSLSSRRAMSLAQRLYEAGYITYMRTDSTAMSSEAVAEAAGLIKSSFGEQYWAGRYKQHDRKVAGAQEAHECIRPTGMARPRREVEAEIRHDGGRDAEPMARVYDLIWKRTVASLMTPAVYDAVSVDISATPAGGALAPPVRHLFRATGSTLRFDGFIRIYREGSDDPEEEEGRLPALTPAQALRLIELLPEQHHTQPPPRYTEASLVKELEDKGIGRPSTYASIMGTLVEEKRDYTHLNNRRFVPTDTGEVTTDFLVRYFGDHFMDFTFTSDMESHLDGVAEGRFAYQPTVESFYGPLQERLGKGNEVSKEEVTTEATDQICPDCGSPMAVKLGKRGKFLGCTNYPECKKTLPMPGQEREAPELLEEKCPDCGAPLAKRSGRFGPFIGCSTYPECKYIQKKPRTTTGHPCPKCAAEPCKTCKAKKEPGELIERVGKRGKFYGCGHYPACRHTQNQDPREVPVEGGPAPAGPAAAAPVADPQLPAAVSAG
jgi:DNA topoisomerase-1